MATIVIEDRPERELESKDITEDLENDEGRRMENDRL